MTLPQIVDPQTGEALDLPELNARMVRILDQLDVNGRRLEPMIRERGDIQYEYDRLYYATVAVSTERMADRRKGEAIAACHGKLLTTGEPLGSARNRLDVSCKALEAACENLRHQLSGYQTLANNLRAEITGLGSRP